MFRSCQIIIRELYSLLKLYYGIHNSILICKRGVVWQHIMLCGNVLWSSWLGVRRTTHAGFSLHTDTTPPQPNHNITPTHIEPKQYNP